MYNPKYSIGDHLLISDVRWTKKGEQEPLMWVAHVIDILFEKGWSGQSAYKVVNVTTEGSFYPLNSSHAADHFDPMATKITNLEMAIALYGKKEGKEKI